MMTGTHVAPTPVVNLTGNARLADLPACRPGSAKKEYR